MPAFTPQPQSVTALWPVLISRPAEGTKLKVTVLDFEVAFLACFAKDDDDDDGEYDDVYRCPRRRQQQQQQGRTGSTVSTAAVCSTT